jgi:MFS family permease
MPRTAPLGGRSAPRRQSGGYHLGMIPAPGPAAALPREERRVILASSLGTMFEWYDFYLYATLAPFFADLFFPRGNDTAALLSAFATYAAGFLVRPFGALVFGRVGDMVGRKYTFLVTIVCMGAATFAVGLLPTYASIGWLAPTLLVTLRLIQGLALGGEYGGAATYVAEHAPEHRRGANTSWIQTTATLGFFLALVVILGCRTAMSAEAFAEWGWRLPFALSALLLVFSVYIRLRLEESPVFLRIKQEGRTSAAPLTESFARWGNARIVLLSLFGATAGQGVVWYTGQFYALFFLTITLKLDFQYAYLLIAGSLLVGTPLFIFFGWLSDRIGRLRIIMVGCLLAALTYIPLFRGLTHYVNPALEAAQAQTSITVVARDCSFHLFVGPWSTFSECDRARDHLTKSGVSFNSTEAAADEPDVVTTIGTTVLTGFDASAYGAALRDAAFPARADPAQVNWVMAELILIVMVLYVTMVYGPIAAFLVELFPARIRYTSMSLPYHIGDRRGHGQHLRRAVVPHWGCRDVVGGRDGVLEGRRARTGRVEPPMAEEILHCADLCPPLRLQRRPTH